MINKLFFPGTLALFAFSSCSSPSAKNEQRQNQPNIFTFSPMTVGITFVCNDCEPASGIKKWMLDCGETTVSVFRFFIRKILY